MKQLITIHNLSFSYGNEVILDNINASFELGKLSIILGRNGSGKSTMFNILAGLEKKYTGDVFFKDQERRAIKLGSQKQIRIGFLNQFHQTTFPFSVKDVLLTGRDSFSKFAPSKEDIEEVENILIRFNLFHLINKPYTSLSGGERQLVLLSRVLVQKPDVLMLDEPTNHLDVHYQVAVLKCIQQLAKEGTTILCVMHDPNLAFMFGDRFYLMQDKNLIDIENLEDDAIHKLLEKTYQLPLHRINNQGKTMFMPLI